MVEYDEMRDRLDQHDRRLDEHGNRLDSIDGRLTIHAERVERHEQLLLGDDELGLTGLVTQLREISHLLEDLATWRQQLVTYGGVITTAVKITVALLGRIGFGVWWPLLVELYHRLIGG